MISVSISAFTINYFSFIKEDILRRSKLIRGNEGVPGNPGIAAMGSQIAPALHITEDTSRRSREHRAELLRFMREVRKVRHNL